MTKSFRLDMTLAAAPSLQCLRQFSLPSSMEW